MIDQLIKIDAELFLYLNNLGIPFWDGFWMFITRDISWVPMYLLIAVLLIRNYGWAEGLIAISLLLLLLGFTDQTTNFFKYSFKRLRPCHNLDIIDQIRLVKPYCGGRFGFTSAHAANSFAFAICSSLILRNRLPWYPYLILLWAGSLAYSRVYIGVHYPLDIFFGSCFGFISGLGFYFIYWKIKKTMALNIALKNKTN